MGAEVYQSSSMGRFRLAPSHLKMLVSGGYQGLEVTVASLGYGLHRGGITVIRVRADQ